MEPEYHLTLAARMLGGPSGDPGLMHVDLIHFIDQINSRCGVDHTGAFAGIRGELVSRQVIALAIETWLILNPDQKAYGE